MSHRRSESNQPRQPLAIVGIGCRLPGGVVDAQSFWEMLTGRRSGIVEVPENRWNRERYYHKDRAIPGRMVTKWGGFVDNLDLFDPGFWGISPREAMRMDPQQRWLLEVTWEAIEDAGIAPATLRGRSVGVYVGIASNDYAGLQMPNWDETDVHTNSGCTLSIASNRIAYMFDFKGPAVSVDTACSSALVAMSQACNAIWSGECEAAVTGGVNALITPHATIGFSKASMLSPSGQCFAFDDRADGYVRGEGAAMVLIKPYEQAAADGDPIYAVIRAAVVNQDGHTSSMTVPSVEGQSEMLRMAYRDAGITPGRVVYMEAHGTGTQVGDPIEATALGNILSEGRPEGDACLIGSCKTNIGHLESGSGAAGLLKAALVLHHDMAPPNLNFKNPNPHIPFDRLRLKVVTDLQPLPRQQGRLPVAAVNSFGFGGTNAHIVLEAAPPHGYGGRVSGSFAKTNGKNGHHGKTNGLLHPNAHLRGVGRAVRPCLLPISARDEESLKAYVKTYHDFLDEPSRLLSDVCYSAGMRKEHHPHRLVVMGDDTEQMRSRMAAWLDEELESEGIIEGRASAETGAITFVFTGQGAQWWKMGRELFDRESIFRRMMWRIDALLEPLAGWSLVDAMMKPESEEESEIHRTSIAQPGIFALQVALAELWKSWGIRPAKVIGHSVGEVAAAYCAGIYSLEDAVKVIVHRSRLQDSAGGDGRMLAAGVSAAEARAAIGERGDQVQVAVVNSPSLVTIAGDREPLEEIAATLEEDGKFVRWLRINYAFHTHHMDPIKDELLEALADIKPRPSRIPFISTVTASVLSGEKLDAKYWWRNVRQPVLFGPAMSNLVLAGERVFLELGPHPALESAVREILASQGKQGEVFHSLKRKTDETNQILSNLAGLHTAGASVDWASVNQSGGQYVRLPRYPWHYERYWLESEEMAHERLDSIPHPFLGQRMSGAKPTWQFKLDPRLFSYLNDHQIWDSIIFPAAGYAEIGLAVARELFPDEPYVVEEMQSKKGLFVSEDKVPLIQVIFDDADNSYRVFSQTRGGDWELNAQGRLIKYVQPEEPPTVDLKAIRQPLTGVVEHERYYDEFDEAGYGFGLNFRHIQKVWRVAGEAVGQIEAPEEVQESVDEYHFHPAMLDACFQVSKAVQIIEDEENAADYLYLPESIRRVQLYRDKPPVELWSHVELLHDDGDTMITNIYVYDNDGQRVADILGFRVERMEQNRSGAEDLDNCYYQLKWEVCEAEADDAEADEPSEEAIAARSVLILADETGVAEDLAARLTEHGDKATCIRPGDDLAERLSKTPWDAIVHCWTLDHPEAAKLDSVSLANAQSTGVLSTLTLQQALAEQKWESPPRVYVVGRDVQHVVEGDQTSGVSAAPIVGFARVANNEHPQFRWTLIDLDRQSDDGGERIFQEMADGDDELEIAWRGGHRLVNRLKRVRAEELPPRRQPGFASDGRAVAYRLQTSKPGVLTNLSLNETRRRDPAADEIEVRIKAGGINFRDVMKALGMYPGNPVDLLWFGDDFSGVVERVGENVTNLNVGDEVAGMAPYCFRAFCNVDHRMVFKKPAHMSFEEAATLPTVFLTAHYCLNELAHMSPGEKVLIHAGAGGVGQAAIQVAKHIGLEIFATAGTPDKRKLLHDMGVDHVMNSRTLEFADQVMDITEGRGVDAVLNSLAGEFIPKNFSVLAPFGRFLEIGKIDVYNNSKIGLETLKNNISYFVIDLAQHLQEKPAYIAKMFAELSERFASGDYKPLTHSVFPIAEVVEAFRFMAQGKHVGKNVLSFDADGSLAIGPCTEPEHLLRGDRTYLITGGAGGFGLELAKWMVEHGARHLALMSRSGPRDEAKDAIEHMRAGGAKVLDARGDVTSLADVQRVVDQIQSDMPPLAGVVHGAVVLDDEFIADLDEARFSRVLNPKMIGAWNLHLATCDLPLEHFISFSSFSNVIGGTKQSNYNAGNSFLDALAHYRHAQGLPALTFNWGALQGAGILTRDEKTAQYLDKLGMKAFNVAETLKVVGKMILLDPVQVGASRMTWPSVAKISPLVARSNTYAELAQESLESGGGSVRARVLAAAPEQRQQVIEDFLAGQVASVFGEEIERIDRETPLTNLGLDSLMTIDLMNRVESELGLSIPMGSVLRGPNLQDLAEILLDLIGEGGAGQEGDGAEGTSESTALAPLEKVVGSEGEFPLTEGQQALWFLYRLAPQSSAYNLTFSAKFTPHVDIEAMKRAFASLFAQHPMLDVTFSDASGEPRQRLRRGGTIQFREHDATGLSESEVNALLVKHANEPFDLENGPVTRLELFRTEDGHIGLLSAHHIISDAWSITVLIKDLIESYFSLRAGRSPQYPPQPFTYEDFVAWERNHLESDSGRRMRNFWLESLQSAPQTIDLPTDRPRPPVQTFRGGTFSFRLDDELTHDILTLAAEQNVTLFTLLLSAYESLLHRHTGQDDFLVGVPLAGRSQRELYNTVGYFVNPVPVRSRIDDDPTFLDLLSHTSERMAGALDNQHYPLKRLVNDMNVPRDTSRSPLFQVAFSMERIPGFDEQGIAVFLIGQGGHRFHLGDITVETVDLTLRQAQFEILLVVEEAGGSIYGCWQYNRDLFDVETIQRLNDLYADVLRQLLDNPTRRISQFQLGEATADEDDTIGTWQERVRQWHQTDRELSSNLPVHQRIEQQAARTPGAVAVICGDEELTYETLNERANQLAHHLRSLGVGLDSRVGVCMSRSVDLIVAIQGVLKAGGAYVPLDPSYPPQRLETIATSAGMSVVVTQNRHARRLGDHCGQLVRLDGDWQTIARQPVDNPQPLAGMDNLIYVIYTSGTTGEPKGAGVYHKGFANLLDWFLHDFEIGDSDRSLVITSHGFDLTQKNLYAALMVGGQVHLTAGDDFDPDRILAEIEQSQVTLLNCTPSMFYPLADEATGQLDSLRLVFLGGEPIDMTKLAAWRGREGFATELVNTYGPTECTDICSFYRVGADSDEREIPVGFPIYNVQTHVLDVNQKPVAPGVTGELCITGAGVGAGYINDQELTREKFVASPLLAGASERMYRTGDLCRYRADGAIEFVGRIDHQVKIRGFRIELGEIESHLRQHPQVHDAVVIARQDKPHVKRLVGYVIFEDGEAPSVAELREFLQDLLPDYMTPSYFVSMEAFPLTPHGKIDRHALPAPVASGDESPSAARHVAPRDEVESSLAEIWRDVLQVERIGVLDGFFDLGGDSLSCVQLVSKIRRKFDVEVPLAVVLQGDTIAQVAAFMRQRRQAEWSALAPIQPNGDRPPLYLIHPVGGNVLCYSDLIDSLGEDQPVYGIQARGVDGALAPFTTVEEMVEEYIEAIQAVQPKGPYHFAAWSSGGVVAYEMARRLQQAGETIGGFAMFDSLAPSLLDFDADDEVAVLMELVEFFKRFYELNLDVTRRELAPLPSDERLRLILDRARQRNPFLPSDIDEDYARRFLAVCRANLQAIDAYQPAPAELPVVLYRAADPAGRSGDVGAADLGWRPLLGAALQVEPAPGNHVSMLTGENARRLAEKVRQQMTPSEVAASD